MLLRFSLALACFFVYRAAACADAPRPNIIVFNVTADAPDAPSIVARARDRGVLVIAFGPRTIRLVTHLDVSRSQCEQAADILLTII